MTTDRDPRTQALKDFGATFKPAPVTAGQAFWAIIRADGPIDMGGNHNIYVDTLDAEGKREVGVPVEFYWDSDRQHTVHYSEAKPGEQQATNEPIWAGNHAYGVRIVDNAMPSDEIDGMGLVPFEGHRSYLVIFQRQIAASQPVPHGPTPGQSLSALENIDAAMLHLRIARDQLTGG